MNSLVAIVTVAAILFYFWTALGVATARGKSGIDAPAMTGDPLLERAVRVQMNTLEFMPIFLPSLWLFAWFVPAPYGAPVAAALGVVWIVGRFLYMRGYMAAASKRSLGFMVQGAATLILLLGGLIGAVVGLVTGG